jgi:TetR/AcrR family transcriptional regulator, transcriptional repressor for nem operon
VSSRRIGAETSQTRALLLDSAERLMIEQGYAAVSYRKVAASAGVAPALVQYYFPALDDLFVALVRRRTDESLVKLTRAFATRTPLRVVFDYARDPRGAALTAELHALANHRKVIANELASGGEQVRRLALDALDDAVHPLSDETLGAEVLVFLMTALPRMLVMEGSVGITTSLSETTAFLEAFLDRVEPR